MMGEKEAIIEKMAAMSEERTVTCPHCQQSDEVWKTSDILSGHLPVDAQPVVLASRLSISDEMWAEIEKKDRDEVGSGSGRLNRSLGILFCALGGFLLVNQVDPQWAWLGLLAGMLVGGVFFNYLPNRMVEQGWAAARLAREKAQQRYADLYYCQRDDLVFLPEEGLSAPADELIELLYHG
jgi:hypothetical protein